MNISFGDKSLQNKSFVHVDSFFPGIVLPKEAWQEFENYTAQMKNSGQ